MTKTIRTGVVVACLASLASCGRTAEQPGGPGPGHYRSRDVVVFVHLFEQAGICKSVAGAEVVKVHKDDKLVWEVLNDCAADQDVEFTKFKKNNQDDDPTDTPNKKPNVKAGKTEKLKVGFKQNPAKGKYKYSIMVGTYELDPELEIDY